MKSVPLELRFSKVQELTKMKRRGRGFGVKGSAHTVFWPDYDSYDLGVLIGMLYGDGNLIKRSTGSRTGKWRIEFCEGDLGVVKAFVRLTHNLFNVKPTIRNRVTWYEAYFCSRIVYEFMTHIGEHPNGKKTGKLRIPELAKRNTDALRGLVAGIFSVEGSVSIHGKKERLQIEMLEPSLIRALHQYLQEFGLQAHSYHYRKNRKIMHGLNLRGGDECQAFLSGIGLIGKRKNQLTRLLRSPRQARPAR